MLIAELVPVFNVRLKRKQIVRIWLIAFIARSACLTDNKDRSFGSVPGNPLTLCRSSCIHIFSRNKRCSWKHRQVKYQNVIFIMHHISKFNANNSYLLSMCQVWASSVLRKRLRNSCLFLPRKSSLFTNFNTCYIWVARGVR